jgi:hypothetical protein
VGGGRLGLRSIGEGEVGAAARRSEHTRGVAALGVSLEGLDGGHLGKVLGAEEELGNEILGLRFAFKGIMFWLCVFENILTGSFFCVAIVLLHVFRYTSLTIFTNST